jgi:hypothetical protein
MTGTSDDNGDAAAKRRREELWEAFLCRFLPERPASDLKRQHDALDLIAAELKLAAARPDDAAYQHNAFQHVAVLVQLLGGELGRALLELEARAPFLEPKASSPADTVLGRFLDVWDMAISPLHLAALDPVVLIVPRPLRSKLRAAVASADGDRGRAWNQMRMRALEHVEFQNAQGTKKEAIRADLGMAMGVEGGTIRDWKQQLAPLVPNLESRLADAREAGKLVTKLQRDPDFGTRPGESLNGHAYALLLEIRDEPWEAFAKRYRERFEIQTSSSKH